VGTRVAKLPQEKLEELCEMSQEELKANDDLINLNIKND
jgi:hypothetical protein